MKLLTLRDVADMVQLSEQTVRRQVRKGALPARKVAGVIRVEEGDAHEFARGIDYGRQLDETHGRGREGGDGH